MTLEHFEKLEEVRKIPFAPGKGGMLKKLAGRTDLTIQEIAEAHCFECQGFYKGKAIFEHDCGKSDCPLYILHPYNKDRIHFNRVRYVHGVLREMSDVSRPELRDNERVKKLERAGEKIKELKKEILS